MFYESVLKADICPRRQKELATSRKLHHERTMRADSIFLHDFNMPKSLTLFQIVGSLHLRQRDMVARFATDRVW
jgi:hypothetical protein